MSDFIKDIPSDSTIKKVELKESTVTIMIGLGIYEDDKNTKSFYFTDVAAANILPGWNLHIEGIQIKTTSELLQRTRKLLKEAQEPEENVQQLNSYQILSSWGNGDPVIEIIARTYEVEEI